MRYSKSVIVFILCFLLSGILCTGIFIREVVHAGSYAIGKPYVQNSLTETEFNQLDSIIGEEDRAHDLAPDNKSPRF